MFAGLVKELTTKRYSPVTIQALNENAPEVVSPSTDVDNFVKTYQSHPYTYSAIFEIANAAASVPIKINVINGDEKDELDEGPIVDLLKRPNQWMSRRDLWEFHYTSMETTGMSFWELEPTNPLFPLSPSNPPKAIYPLRSDKMEILPGKDSNEYIRGYRYRVGQTTVDYPPDWIIMFKYCNPGHDYLGLSPLEPAKKSIMTDLYAMAWNLKFFENGARPDGAWVSKEIMTDPQIRRLREDMDAKYNGINNFRRPMIAEAVEWVDATRTHHDMDFLNLRKENTNEILATTGVQKLQVALGEQINKATAEVEMKLFWDKTMRPKMNKHSDMLNMVLMPLFAPNLMIEHDFTAVEVLMPNRNELMDALTRATNVWLAPNDARRMFNRKMNEDLEELDNGNDIQVQLGTVPLGEQDIFLNDGESGE